MKNTQMKELEFWATMINSELEINRSTKGWSVFVAGSESKDGRVCLKKVYRTDKEHAVIPRDLFSCGYIDKGDLFNRIKAYYAGIVEVGAKRRIDQLGIQWVEHFDY